MRLLIHLGGLWPIEYITCVHCPAPFNPIHSQNGNYTNCKLRLGVHCPVLSIFVPHTGSLYSSSKGSTLDHFLISETRHNFFQIYLSHSFIYLWTNLLLCLNHLTEYKIPSYLNFHANIITVLSINQMTMMASWYKSSPPCSTKSHFWTGYQNQCLTAICYWPVKVEEHLCCRGQNVPGEMANTLAAGDLADCISSHGAVLVLHEEGSKLLVLS